MAKNKSHLLPNSADYYEVEEIIDKKLTSNGMMYLIRWAGFPDPKDFTWEPVQHLTEVERLVKEFNQRLEKSKTKKEPIKLSTKLAEKLKKHSEEEKEEEQEEKFDEDEVMDLDAEEGQEVEPKPARSPKRPKKQRPQLKIHKRNKQQRSQSQDESEPQESKPRKIDPRRLSQPQNPPEEIDKFWQKQGFHLGRIHKHYVVDGDLLFNVNLEKEGMVWGIIYLSYDTLLKLCKDKLIDFMENHLRNRLIQERELNTDFAREFQKYWSAADQQK